MKLQEQNTAKMSRKEKRAAKAEVKTEFKRAAKTSKAELLENMLLEARESGKQSALKRSRRHVFDRIRHTAGAPKSVKAARREMKVKTQTLADLLLSDDDCFSE